MTGVVLTFWLNRARSKIVSERFETGKALQLGQTQGFQHEERLMELPSVEIKLLLAIHAGQSVVKGEDVHAFRHLIAKGYAEGVDASDGDGNEFIEVRLTPSGREIASDLYTDE